MNYLREGLVSMGLMGFRLFLNFIRTSWTDLDLTEDLVLLWALLVLVLGLTLVIMSQALISSVLSINTTFPLNACQDQQFWARSFQNMICSDKNLDLNASLKVFKRYKI